MERDGSHRGAIVATNAQWIDAGSDGRRDGQGEGRGARGRHEGGREGAAHPRRHTRKGQAHNRPGIPVQTQDGQVDGRVPSRRRARSRGAREQDEVRLWSPRVIRRQVETWGAGDRMVLGASVRP